MWTGQHCRTSLHLPAGRVKCRRFSAQHTSLLYLASCCVWLTWAGYVGHMGSWHLSATLLACLLWVHNKIIAQEIILLVNTAPRVRIVCWLDLNGSFEHGNENFRSIVARKFLYSSLTVSCQRSILFYGVSQILLCYTSHWGGKICVTSSRRT